MGNGVSIIEDILNGKDLLVVLENRYGKHYKESYDLDTVIIKGNLFWGKFPCVHSPVGHKPIDITTPLAYAYNNFSDVVCTMNYENKIQRYVSTKIYSRMQYKTKGNYRLAVDGLNESSSIDHHLLNNAVENSLKIKMIICEDDSFIHVVPVHTIELYEDQLSVGIDTNFESVPSLLYNFNYFDKLEANFNERLKDSPESKAASTDYIGNSHFTLISYVIVGSDIRKLVLNSQGKIESTIITYKWFKVYCEVN
ncbi:MAG: hypothetical protein RPR97_03600 [Colwellia sp.]|jgi:hypothetical protein